MIAGKPPIIPRFRDDDAICYRHSSEVGALYAYNSLRPLCSIRPDMQLFGHGGPRNKADRISDYLTAKQAQKIIGAVAKANQLGFPINRHITIHWGLLGLSDTEVMAKISVFLKAFREWAGGLTAYAWVRENGEVKGSHLHLLAHIPPHKSWHGAMVRRWLERISGNPYRKGAIKTRYVVGSKAPDGAIYRANIHAVTAYILKGVSPDTAEALGIAHKPSGQIMGKRSGTSRNAG